MAGTGIPSMEEITGEQFAEYLGRYKSCIQEMSTLKANSSQRPLVNLDNSRYEEALKKFSSASAGSEMQLDDVKSLVEWKLRHGKFRPTLMKLISSNEPDFVRKTIQEAVGLYRDQRDVFKSLDLLVQIKGIGPATASLLLAVHDPAMVIFFADEAFYWLCCDGKVCPLKYNMKEYRVLNARALDIVQRLKVRAVDVERVAFVLIKQSAAHRSIYGGSQQGPVSKAQEQPMKTKRRKASSLEDEVTVFGNAAASASTKRSKRKAN